MIKNSIDEVISYINSFKNTLKTKNSPVGVFFSQDEIDYYENLEERFCISVKEASQGKEILTSGFIECYSSQIMLGLIECKYVNLEDRIKPPIYKSIRIGPLEKINPCDIILFIVNPKQCMYLISSCYKILKKPITPKLSARTAVCGEVAAYIMLNNRPSLSFLCSGSRIFGNYKDDELIFGIPFSLFDQIVPKLKEIVDKEIETIKLLNENGK
ncbi:MAG: DUF169 domain-containing protein [Candidatus Helarchaeota archaeon]